MTTLGVFRLHLSVLLSCEWWGRITTTPNIEAVPNKRQPGDSPEQQNHDPKVPTTVYGSTLDLAIDSPEVAAIADFSQLEALTSDHIATVIILSQPI